MLSELEKLENIKGKEDKQMRELKAKAEVDQISHMNYCDIMLEKVNQSDVVPITGNVPDPAQTTDETLEKFPIQYLEYMSLTPDKPIEQVNIDKALIGPCTNSTLRNEEKKLNNPMCGTKVFRRGS
ncbi:hypothetical protein O181_106619 [Austropuccinia psidii MF-1]|uniref:Uncharacterized protein n=1 Tax=Austropuccinia psidii MF-1 TaxID=1389203 RepID=A0A9Q3JSH1_9BASI|nr:hypothetical protein [Austropuccinia psidii MF-1]